MNETPTPTPTTANATAGSVDTADTATAGDAKRSITAKRREQPPTSRQRALVKMARLNPTWTLRRLLLASGYSEQTAVAPGRVMATPTARQADAELRADWRSKLTSRYSLDHAAERLTQLADQGDQPSTALTALGQILVDVGVREPVDRERIADAVRSEQSAYLVGLLRGLLTAEQEQILADKLGADGGKMAKVEPCA